MIESEVKKLKEQMARNAEHAAEEKESIMSALAAAQARASESENAPLAPSSFSLTIISNPLESFLSRNFVFMRCTFSPCRAR